MTEICPIRDILVSMNDPDAIPTLLVEPRAKPPESLGARIVGAVKWQLFSQFVSQGLRFGTNLILTRLLFREAFGMMGMVQVFIVSMHMISDVGLLGSVIHHRRGECPHFLNTVWTIQLIRGVALWLLTCLGAYPFAVFYGMDELKWLLPLTALDTVFRSMASTSLLTARRNIQPKRFILVEMGAQVAGAAVMMLLAAFTHSVYALSIGWVVSGLAYAGLSYLGREVHWNRFEWDREAARSILHFGRWTAGSSTLTIMQLQGDRMVLGKLFDAAQLGVYSIGANLALPALSLFNQISGEVALPTYARIRELPADAVRSKVRRLRRGIVVPLLSVLALTVLVCQPLVDFCYPPEYRDAGWYCSLVAIGMMLQVSTDLGPIFLSHGNARMHFFIMLLRTLGLAAGIAVGYFAGRSLGQPAVGVLYGIVFCPLLYYPIQAACYHRLHAWIPEVDLPGIAVALAMFVVRWQLLS